MVSRRYIDDFNSNMNMTMVNDIHTKLKNNNSTLLKKKNTTNEYNKKSFYKR